MRRAAVGKWGDNAGDPARLLRELDAIVKREHRRAHTREWEFIDNRVPPEER